MSVGPLHKFFGSQAALPVVTIGASILGVALNLVLPFLMAAEEYALYSLMLGLAQLLASLCFEWARINVIRYSHTADAVGDVERRATLAMVYVWTVGMLVLVAATFMLAAVVTPFAVAAAIVVGVSALQGIFDGQQAASRAELDNYGVSARIVARTVVSFAGAVVACLVFRTGEATLIGFALAYPISSFPGLAKQLAGWRSARPSASSFRRMLRFGILAAIGTNLSIAVPAAVRSAVVGSVGLAEAGGILLVIDLAQRAFATVGSAINIVVVQNAIRAVELGDAKLISARVRQQVLLVACVILPSILLFVSLRSLAELVVPSQYLSGFQLGGVSAVIAVGLLALKQYSLDPMFVVLGASTLAPLGSVATLGALSAYVLLTWSEWVEGSMAISLIVLIFAALLGTLVSAAAVTMTKRFTWPLADIVWLALALAASTGVVLLIPTAGSVEATVARSAGSLVLFFLILTVGNVLDARVLLRRLYSRQQAK